MAEGRNTTVPIESIVLNVARQFRAKQDPEVIEEYAELMKKGVEFPRITVMRLDDSTPAKYILVGGDKRYKAHIINKQKDVPVTVIDGMGERAAIEAGAKDNYAHGVRPTINDRRKTIKLVLSDKEWWDKSDLWVADFTGTSNHLVKDVREEMKEEFKAQGQERSDDSRVSRGKKKKGVKRIAARKVKKLKKGQELFDFESYEKSLRDAVRGPDDIARAYKAKDDPDYAGLVRLGNEYLNAYREWKKKIVKEYLESEKASKQEATAGAA